MALYTPDWKLKQAIEVIKNLSDEGNDALIKYYIQKDQEHIDSLNKRIKEMQEVFNGIQKFTRY